MSKNYRWGIIGAGHIAEKFCTALNFSEGAQVYAVASRDTAKAAAFGARHNAEVIYDNYEALMKDENVDIVYIAIPHVFHYAQTMACLQNGKPVLCEKPLSLSYQHTKEIIDTAREKQLFFMEGMWTACMPVMNKIRTLIAEGLIGEPQYLSADFGFNAPVNLEGRLYNKRLGGGAMMDVGVYPLYLATAIFGEPSQLKLVSNLTKTGVDEYVNLSLQYSNRASAQLIASIVFQTNIEATIIGTKGRVNIKNPWFKATAFEVLLNDGSSQQYSMPHQSNGFEHEIKEVMHCLDNGLRQSEKMPHELSLLMAKITGEILSQAGVEYE
jgi:predicted dehydrogenase